MNRRLLFALRVACKLALVVGVSTSVHAERTIYGRVVDSQGHAVSGYRVRAFDQDPVGGDEKMCETTTGSDGSYSMTYRKGTWDGPKVGTSWRPDIYVVVAKPYLDDGWKRVDQTGVRDNWHVRDDIRADFHLPADGECPFPAEFDTTGVWHGCSCPTGTYKRWLDLLNWKARCAVGQSPEDQCKAQGKIWIGMNNTKGVCAAEPDIPSAHRAFKREAYYRYMQRVAKGASMESVPAWIISRYQQYYHDVDLRNVKIGESDNTPSDSTAITDCQKVYFPRASGEVAKIRTQAPDVNYHWFLHELAHSNQCMGLVPGTLSFSTKRDEYADMWFRNMPQSILVSIMTDGIPVDDAIHDHMPMEADADRQAATIIRATGIGTIPSTPCPSSGEFSTRDKRGCTCPAGTVKTYKGTFDEKAECRTPNP